MASSAPPPLKKRRRDEPDARPGLGSLALDLSGLDVEDEEPSAPKRNDDDATAGDWLFKQDDVVLGPVSAAVLVQRIEQGELAADTPVGREAGKWRPLKSVAYFKEILEKAEARQRAIKEQLEREARRRRQRMTRWSTLAALFVVPFLLGAVAGRAVWIAKPWDRGDEWLQRPPPLVDLPPKPAAPEPKKDDDPRADDERVDDERVADGDDGEGDGDADKLADNDDKREGKSGKKATKKASSKKASQKKRQQKADTKVAKADEKKKKDDDDGGGAVLQTLTQQQVMAPVRKSSGAIGRCLKTEVARNPDMPSRVTLMWTVTEAGKATSFKLKEREVRAGPMADCLGKVFARLRWPRFTGERKNVELPLGVKK